MIVAYPGRVAKMSAHATDPAARGRFCRVLSVRGDSAEVTISDCAGDWKTTAKLEELHALTEKQDALAKAHGLPAEFFAACLNASNDLMCTDAEAKVASQKYTQEFLEAGKTEPSP